MECAGQDGVVDTASFRRACLYDVRPRKRGLSITTYRNGANDDDDYSRASRLPRCHMFIDVFASTAGKSEYIQAPRAHAITQPEA